MACNATLDAIEAVIKKVRGLEKAVSYLEDS
jgi:hypothetical protein